MEQRFGDRLKAIRLEHRMSQEDFARLLGTSKQVISRYETNQRTPKITVANRYAEILNVPISGLLGESCQPRKMEAAFDDFTCAIQSEIRGLTVENRQKLLEMARIFKLAQEQQKNTKE
ncbi:MULTISPECIES: helix-turn-helix domain-containing protein [Acutalibacteraceae]|uniref:helix-turn-helix domain-containing protein n=1 Tax=Acutalibacteraceae TaxID=3082771 RepID=UPI0013E8D1DB|nr:MULTISPECIES: helix-turn-helix transcriptional regulator [Acutalibacteraceae]